ncbi:hypothetical protein E2562_012018 [Oryza meyeriana var. granulata]|uniref:Uncharacterized protein n=1 Tax=Oryza meyeriana var. granulata TaxID=110450 RepID=A0A6G1D362_9ORYZ|nr:hypothetical protein E2562_012018 [Oryza meyeriana var. granulata]
MAKRRPGPGWVERMLEMRPLIAREGLGTQLKSRLSGAERQRGRHQEEMTCVRAASLLGRMATGTRSESVCASTGASPAAAPVGTDRNYKISSIVDDFCDTVCTLADEAKN